MTDMDRLIEAVEAGKAITSPMLAAIPLHSEIPTRRMVQNIIHDGRDLTSAMRLHDALLPGWFWNLATLCEPFDGKTVSLTPNGEWRVEVHDGYRGWPDDDDPEDHFQSADSTTPARAWLIAILKALRAKDAANG